MIVRDWIDRFLAEHIDRFGPHDWPDWGSPAGVIYMRDWVTSLIAKGATEAEALAASESLVLEPPNFRREHIPAICRAIEAARARDGTQGSDPREIALRAGTNCPECSPGPPDGKPNGLVVRWHPRPDPANRIPATIACYCHCAYGRWIKGRHAEKNPEYLRCFGDLALEQTGRAWWLQMPPEGYTLGGYREGELAPRPAWLDRPAKGAAPLARPLGQIPLAQARQWADSPDPILRAEGRAALAAAGEAPTAAAPAQPPPPVQPPRPRPRRPPWEGAVPMADTF